ncbi:MAG: hypothetical protein AAF360_19425, partial [Pseudomonadota bacterium]
SNNGCVTSFRCSLGNARAYAGCVQALLDAGAIILPEAGHFEMGDPAINAMVAAAYAARGGNETA